MNWSYDSYLLSYMFLYLSSDLLLQEEEPPEEGCGGWCEHKHTHIHTVTIDKYERCAV